MTMTWTSLTTKDIAAGPIAAPWVAVTEPFEDFDHLLIEAEGEWSLFAPSGIACGPDGIAVPLDTASLVVTACRPGALIGKLGGSSAARNAAAAEAPLAEGAATPPYSPTSFAIGTRAIIPVPANCYGPLFIGFNLAAGAIELKSLKLTVKGAKLG